jgi:hypothetical protein
MIRNSLLLITVVALGLVGLVGCDSDDIDSDEEARRAYFGLDKSIEKSLTLGFAGFNAASSANIPPQMTTGDVAGTLTITGQVDQGASANKGMRLRVGMVGYSDGPLTIKNADGEEEVLDVEITYSTVEDTTLQPYLELKLMNIPNGTFTGSLTGPGTYLMTGDIEGEAELNLMFSGQIKDDGTGKVIRTPGTTVITGGASSGDGTFEVNITL